MQLNKGKQLSDFPFTYFCNKLGVKLTESTAKCPNPIPFQSELIKFKNIQQAVDNLNEDSDEKELYAIIGAAIRAIGDVLPDVPAETLENVITNATEDVIPGHSCPIKDKKCREQSQGLCNMLCFLPGIKAPG
jgi:hypothetical protein